MLCGADGGGARAIVEVGGVGRVRMVVVEKALLCREGLWEARGKGIAVRTRAWWFSSRVLRRRDIAGMWCFMGG